MEQSKWSPLIQDILKQAIDAEAVPGGEPTLEGTPVQEDAVGIGVN